MKKKIFLFFLPGLIIFGAWKGYRIYGQYKERQYKASFYENLVDTNSPTVAVLRDSILIGYQNEKRTLHIYVPPDYEQDSLKSYPVMYFMDGESSFNDLENMGPEWEIDEVINAAFENGKQTAIVIGINQAENRDAEYTPFINKDNPDAHGDKFATWVSTELKAWVDTNFRTKQDAASTYIGGISRSGMMAYYFLMAHPEVFGNAIIQSPSMWVDNDRLLAMNLTPSQLQDKKIFVSVGEYEGGTMISGAENIYNKFKEQGMKDHQLKYELIMGESHWHVTWRKSFALAFPWFME